jgi:hypothetical protein
MTGGIFTECRRVSLRGQPFALRMAMERARRSIPARQRSASRTGRGDPEVTAAVFEEA